MICMEESQQLMEKFIELRELAKNSKEYELEFKKHERLCISKFQYIIKMKTSRYKKFSNYDDLNQEGNEALVKAMKNYNPKLGNFFWWCHRYVDTRISRSANLHTTIRYPLKVAKKVAPHRQSTIPVMIEENYCPDKQFEGAEISLLIDKAKSHLTNDQCRAIDLAFGFEDRSLSINKICKKMNISRSDCLKLISTAIVNMKNNINF